MMVTIWREKIMRLHVVDTVLLHNDITENVTMGSSELTVIQHKFMEYGIYQDCGTGRGYEIDGQLYNDGHRGHICMVRSSVVCLRRRLKRRITSAVPPCVRICGGIIKRNDVFLRLLALLLLWNKKVNGGY